MIFAKSTIVVAIPVAILKTSPGFVSKLIRSHIAEVTSSM